MPPVSMTRAEYEKKYGVAPVAPPVSKIDTTPSPIRMSREEYTKTYGVTPEGKKPENNPVQNILERKPSFPANEDTSNPLGNIARTFGNIPSSAINLGRTLVTDPAQNILESDKAILDIYKNRGLVEGTKDILGGFADTYLSAGEAIYGGIEEAYNALLDNPKDAVEKTSNSLAKIGIEDPLFIPSLLYGGEAVGSKDLISKIASPITRGADTRLTPIITEAGKGVEEAIGDISKGIREKQVADTADEIYAVEQNYSKARKLNQYATDGGSDSRARIARSNVLEGSVTTDGVIRTKQPGGAVERYRADTIDGYEDVVKKGLEREGSKANLVEVRRALVLEVNRSGLEGADLVTAMNGIKKEIAGLARRADESGNIFLAKLHDAKIGTTRNINYQTPPETATYRKAVARAYKNTIENKSNLNVKQVNDELAKYYKDIERLEGLDGLRVKGGKLGKYTAQIAGNVGGGLVGGVVGGIPGAAIGTVVGGEISSSLKGRALSESFGKLKEGEIPRSSILEDAKAQNQLPKVVDLKTPDPIVGVRKDIPKTKEVIEIEAQIKNNVRKQKAAIKAGDFTLVEKLKEIYQALVEKLREVVKVITEKGPPQRGFIRIGGEGKDVARSGTKSSVKSPSKNTTTEPETFKGFTDLSTKLLKDLEGKTAVSKQYILDATNRADLKQPEKDLFRNLLQYEGDKINVPDFANKVKSELLPLKRAKPGGMQDKYENITLPDELRGPVANYSEHIYNSPIKTSAGGVHFSGENTDNYFAHTRIEDLPGETMKLSEGVKNGGQMLRNPSGGSVMGKEGTTRRVIELQSDLFQKGRLEKEGFATDSREFERLVEEKRNLEAVIKNPPSMEVKANPNYVAEMKDLLKVADEQLEKYRKPYLARKGEMEKLEPYRNTWHERVIREEVKQAAKDGKTKLQFPTGETAMKIEGLGQGSNTWTTGNGLPLTPERLKVGDSVYDQVTGYSGDGNWIITDVLGDGKFKAVPKDKISNGEAQGLSRGEHINDVGNSRYVEEFDISGKVDTENPIYKFYEKEVGKYLKNKYGAQLITDPQGVKWWEVNVGEEQKGLPVEAFGAVGIGAGASTEDNK